MVIFARKGQLRTLMLGMSAAAALTFAPASANAGFFDQLFGGGAPQPAQPTYNYDAAPQQPLSPDTGVPVAPQVKRKLVVRETTPVRQKTTDLWHDKTLRPGDAIMMKDGVRVYNGPEATKHTAKQFVSIDDARSVSSSARAALVALDTTHYTPVMASGNDTLASGRSAAIGAPISKGFKITDARGASVRYVGP